jgi:WD40 repeat protein
MTRPIWTLVCLLTGGLAMTAAGNAVEQDAPKARTDLSGDPLPDGALARLGTLRWSHPRPVIFVAFLPDGKTVLTGCEDRIFRVWNRATGKEIRRIVVPPTPPSETAWRIPWFAVVGALSVDGKTLATAADKQICFWDVSTGKKIRQLEAPKPQLDGTGANDTVKALVFAPDGESLAVRTIDEAVHVIAAATGQPVGQFRDPQEKRKTISGATGAVAFSPDGKRIASTQEEGRQLNRKMFLRVHDIESGKELWRVEMVLTGLFAVAYAPNGKLIAAGTGHDTKLFDADSGKSARRIEKKAHGSDSLLFSADSKYLLATRYVSEYVVWAVDSGEEVHRFGTPRIWRDQGDVGLGWSHGLAVSADGKTLASGIDNTVRMWDLDAGKEIAPAGGSRGAVVAVGVGRDGKRALSRGIDGMIRVWDLADSRELRHFEEPDLTYGVPFAPDGQSLACGVWGEITIVDTNSGQPHKPFKTEMNRTAVLAYSPDSKVVAYLGVRFDVRATKILLQDVATGAERPVIALPVPPAKGLGVGLARMPGGLGTGGLSLAFTPDGRMLVGHFPGNEGLRNPGGKFNEDTPPRCASGMSRPAWSCARSSCRRRSVEAAWR